MNAIISQRLVLVIAALALLSFAGKRKWITPTETGWIGAAMIFAASGWVLQAVLNATRASFASHQQAIYAGIGMTAPLVIALIVALIILVRKLKNS
jgi:hypothetical protein